MVEERELLAHQRAVDAVLAGDLASRPRSSAERSRAARAPAGGDQRAQALERDGGGGRRRARRRRAAAARCAPARARPRRSISVWISASWRARPRRRGRGSPRPGEDEREQAARGGDLRRRGGRAARPRASVLMHGASFWSVRVELRGEADARRASASALGQHVVDGARRRALGQRGVGLGHRLGELAEQDCSKPSAAL